jgi:hypothetical protein
MENKMTFKEWMEGRQRYDFEKMYDDYLRDLELQDQENKYPRDEAAEEKLQRKQQRRLQK